MKTYFFALLAIAFANPALAQNNYVSQDSYLLAQVDPEEAYDPFADYSEFDEETDEEADINFFRNGRFVTAGLAGGFRGFTGGMGKVYKSAPTYGVFLSYFFDLRLAFQLGFMTGDHAVDIATLPPTAITYTGNVSISTLNFDLKYYLATQNLTKGLANLNPYILGGLAQYYRTYTIANVEGYSRDSTMGVDIGAGIEIPLMRKKAYLGLQGTYHYVNFADENKDFIQGTEKLETKISGDFYNFLVTIGTNF